MDDVSYLVSLLSCSSQYFFPNCTIFLSTPLHSSVQLALAHLYTFLYSWCCLTPTVTYIAGAIPDKKKFCYLNGKKFHYKCLHAMPWLSSLMFLLTKTLSFQLDPLIMALDLFLWVAHILWNCIFV